MPSPRWIPPKGGRCATVRDERVVLARTVTPRGEIQLQRRGEGVYEFILNGVFLMASYNAPSSRALAELALARVPEGRRNLGVLVGGLGMGFTLAAALADPRVARVDVVEIEPVLVIWHYKYLSHLAGHPLDDPRVHLIQADVMNYLASTQACYDVLLLDVDNGPEWLSMQANQRLYEARGLQRLRERLAPGGVLAIWSAERSQAFLEGLRAVFGLAEAVEVIDHTPEGREITATIYLAGESWNADTRR